MAHEARWLSSCTNGYSPFTQLSSHVAGRFDPPFSLADPPFNVSPVVAVRDRRLNGMKRKRCEVEDFGGYVCKSGGSVTGFDG